MQRSNPGRQLDSRCDLPILQLSVSIILIEPLKAKMKEAWCSLIGFEPLKRILRCFQPGLVAGLVLTKLLAARVVKFLETGPLADLVGCKSEVGVENLHLSNNLLCCVSRMLS